MKIKKLSCVFTGSRESKLPYSIKSKDHETLENTLKEEIRKLIGFGVSEFYTGGQTGIDTLSALMVIHLKETIGTTANLNLVIPYKGMENRFSELQKADFEFILNNADTVKYMSPKYYSNVFRERNQYMIDKSEFLIAVTDGNPRSGSIMTVNMARKKGMDIRIINPITYDIKCVPPEIDISDFTK